MNKRIQELINQMDQAGLPYGDNAMTVTDRDLEYFAELIVRECSVALSPMLRDMISRGQAYDLIKEHFGVEE
jgi:hypothetical protein